MSRTPSHPVVPALSRICTDHIPSRYNLKRRVASLPPITSEVFTEKVLQARVTSTIEAERTSFQKDCTVCHRNYYSENSYQNHIGSQKHKAKVAAQLRSTQNGAPVIPDDASSMISSTFSLGEPVPSNKSEGDSDAEDEFSNIVEGMKTTGIQERPADADHPMGESSNTQPSASITPTPSKPSEDEINMTINACLFCNTESSDLATNVAHMERAHGMFIPERQYLVDLEGLIKSLQQRVYKFHECLVCEKMKANAYAVQTHMRDTGHCIIPYTTEDEQVEIGEFYDFRSTYSDHEDYDSDEEDETNGGARLGGKRATTTTNEDGEAVEDGEDAGWETDSSASSIDSADLTAMPAEGHYHQYERLDKHPHHSSHDARPHKQRDGFHSHTHKPNRAVFYDEYELHLPNGKSVGHRQHNKYYRQTLRDRDSPAERIRQQRLALENGDDDDDDSMDVDGEEASGRSQLAGPMMGTKGRIMRDQRTQLVARGEAGMLGVTAPQRKEVQKAVLRGRKIENRAQRQQEWQVGKKGNQQKYFNYQIL